MVVALGLFITGLVFQLRKNDATGSISNGNINTINTINANNREVFLNVHHGNLPESDLRILRVASMTVCIEKVKSKQP